MRPTVAVLGAGYAGLAAFAELQERLRPDEADLVLVNKDPYHTFVTEIHLVAGGNEDPSHVRVPLRHVVRGPSRLIVDPVERIEVVGGGAPPPPGGGRAAHGPAAADTRPRPAVVDGAPASASSAGRSTGEGGDRGRTGPGSPPKPDTKTTGGKAPAAEASAAPARRFARAGNHPFEAALPLASEWAEGAGAQPGPAATAGHAPQPSGGAPRDYGGTPADADPRHEDHLPQERPAPEPPHAFPPKRGPGSEDHEGRQRPDGSRPPTALRVHLRGAGTLECAAAVVALGFEPEYYGLPGMRRYSYALSSLASASRLRERLNDLADAADGARNPDRPRVVVAGGGLTGVELAAEIADTYPRRFALILIEGSPEIMPGFDARLVHAARDALTERGVKIHAGVRIAAAERSELAMQGGSRLPYDLLIWAGGIRGNAVVQESGLPANRRGQAKADAYLGAPDHPGVFVAGDCSAPTDPATAQPVPATAQAAIQEGRHAAANVARHLRGEPLVPFHPHMRGIFVSLGRYEGVGKLGAAAIYGSPALLLKSAIEAYHGLQAGGLRELVDRVLPDRLSKPAAAQGPAAYASAGGGGGAVGERKGRPREEARRERHR